MSKTYDKIYALDTNIILNNADNIIELSDSGKNLIVLPETVLDEIDSKKSGFEEINFQARSFARLLQDAKITDQVKKKDISIVHTNIGSCDIHIVSKSFYKSEESQKSIRNDRKILEIISDISDLTTGSEKSIYGDIIFISLDIMARTRSLSLGIPTEALNLGKKDVQVDKDFHLEIYSEDTEDFNGKAQESLEEYDIPKHISSVEITNANGKHYIYFRNKNYGFTLIPEKNEHRLPVPPINKRQKILSEIILDGNDVVVVSGVAGTGKTLVALSSAMRVIDLNRDLYSKIYYIRRTVISGSKEDELGFMPGTLEEKMQGYNTPMEDSIKKVAQLKKRDAPKEVIEEAIFNIKEKYDIEYLYAGHLRGSTLEDGSILICDEIQNFDIASIRTIFSRVGKNSTIIAMGSNNQIDSQYLTKNTNALTFLMDLCGSDNESNVRVKGVKLTNVMRSKISEWADLELYR
jgi:PhoH-like ATPase